jgi:hypothetical protein
MTMSRILSSQRHRSRMTAAVAAVLALGASLAAAGPAAGAGYTFSFASGFVLPAAFDCTTATGCSAGVGGTAHGQFYYPKGAVVIGSDLYVMDHYNPRVEVYDTATRTYERTIVTSGGPGGIATDGTNLYVAATEGRVDVLDAATGALVRRIGKNVGGTDTTTCTSSCQNAVTGDGAGEMSGPTGIDVFNGDVYVSDYNSRRVNVFNATTGAFVKAFGKDVNPSGGDVCTSATGCQQGSNGAAAGVILNSRGLAVSDTGVVYALEDENNHRISVFDAATGAFQYAFGKDVKPGGGNTCTAVTGCRAGTPSNEAGVFSYVRGGHISDGKLYVTDAGNARVEVFDAATGAFEYAIGKNVKPGGGNRCTTATGCQSGTGGTGAGETNGAYGVGVGGGKAYVIDTDSHRVVVFDLADGAFDHAFGLARATGPCTTSCLPGGGGSQAGQFTHPTGAAVYDGELLVADASNGRIVVFNALTGAYTRTFGPGVNPAGGDMCTTSCQSGGLVHPTDLAISGTEVYVAEGDGDRISVYDAATGTFNRAFGKNVGGAGVDTCTSSCTSGTRGTGAGFLQASYGIAVGGGYFFVGDYLNRRVDQFTTAGEFVRAFGDGVNASGTGDPDICTMATGCQEGTGSINVAPGYFGGEVYVPQPERAMVKVYDPATGAFVRAFGKNVGGAGVDICSGVSCQNGTGSSSAGGFAEPWKIVFLGTHAYVSDTGNRRVSVYDASTGAFEMAIGKDVDSVTGDDTCTTNCASGQWSDGAPGGMLQPRGMAIGPDGTIYMADDVGQRVAAYANGDDLTAPVTTDNVPSSGYRNSPVTVTLSAADGASGVDKTYYTTGASPALPTTLSSVYNPAAKPTLSNGERIRYFSTDNAGNAESAHTSSAAKVDTAAPSTTDDVPSADASGTVTVTLNATDSGSSGVDKTYYTTGASPAEPTTASAVYDPAAKPSLGDGERIRYFSTDLAGNAETPHSSGAVKVASSGGSDGGGGSGGGNSGSGGGGSSGGGSFGGDSGSGGSSGGGSFGEDSSGGDGGSGPGGSGSGPRPAGPCAGKKGDALPKCEAYVHYRAFTAKCDALTAAGHQRSCVRRAKRAYQQELELIKCRKLKGKARKRCERKARGTSAAASATEPRVILPHLVNALAR